MKIAVPYPNGPPRGLTLHGTFIFHNVKVLEFMLRVKVVKRVTAYRF